MHHQAVAIVVMNMLHRGQTSCFNGSAPFGSTLGRHMELQAEVLFSLNKKIPLAHQRSSLGLKEKVK